MTYRNKKLLQAAKDAPRCFSCGKYNDGTVVMAHADSQEYGKGMGHKAHDWAVSAICYDCHTIIGDGGSLSREERRIIWRSAHIKTLEWLFESGLVRVAQ